MRHSNVGHRRNRVRACLHKSLIYLDREYIADHYEVATGQSPDTTITSSQGKKAGAAIPVFSAEVSAQETRSFKLSTLGMLAHAWESLIAEPDLDSSKFASGDALTVRLVQW